MLVDPETGAEQLVHNPRLQKKESHSRRSLRHSTGSDHSLGVGLSLEAGKIRWRNPNDIQFDRERAIELSKSLENMSILKPLGRQQTVEYSEQVENKDRNVQDKERHKSRSSTKKMSSRLTLIDRYNRNIAYMNEKKAPVGKARTNSGQGVAHRKKGNCPINCSLICSLFCSNNIDFYY